MKVLIKSLATLATISWALSGCGGGSGGSSVPAPEWNKGTFETADNYKNYCRAPRSGYNSFTGEAYPDAAGTAMHEKMWLRSWSNQTYLWRDEVADIDPANLSILDYFDQLKTFQQTAPDVDKDKFHFALSTAEYQQSSQQGVELGYGIHWKSTSREIPRSLYVAYVEPGSPADTQGVDRGDKLIAVDDVSFIFGNSISDVDKLNAGLSPKTTGEQHQLLFAGEHGGHTLVELTSTSYQSAPVMNKKIVTSNNRLVGYLQFNSHIVTAQKPLIDAFSDFADARINDLVLDLRYNSGGLLAMASQVSYMIAGSRSQNKTFEQLVYNNSPAETNSFGEPNRPTPFYSQQIDYQKGLLTDTLLPTLNLHKVYLLTSSDTCSASEAIMNGLRGIGVQVIQIGETTCGKPYGFRPTDNCGTTYFTIQFSGINEKGFGDYANGFTPSEYDYNSESKIQGCYVVDDLTGSLGNVNETLFSAALKYARNGSCPPARKSVLESELSLLPIEQSNQPSLEIGLPGRYLKSIILDNKILLPPLKEAP